MARDFNGTNCDWIDCSEIDYLESERWYSIIIVYGEDGKTSLFIDGTEKIDGP